MDFCNFKNINSDLADKIVLAGFSGGADSLAMLLILKHFEPTGSYKLKAIHFEHGLRGEESLNEAKFCEEFCQNHNIDLEIINLDVLNNKKKNESIESSARRLRQENFQKIVGSQKDKYVVALGHHQNDAIENLFLHLIRGGNCSSLVNPRRWGEINGIYYYRMLLDFGRLEIEEFLRENGVNQFCIDSSNKDTKYLRNLIRNEILPTLSKHHEHAMKGLARSYEVLSCDADYLDELAKARFEEIKTLAIVPNAYWQSLADAMLVRVLRLYLSQELKGSFIPNYDFIHKFKLIVNNESQESKKIELSENIFYEKQYNAWKISQKITQVDNFCLEWHYLENKTIECGDYQIIACDLKDLDMNCDDKCEFIIDGDGVGDVIYLTTRRNGDKLLNFENKEVKLKKIFIDLKIDINERDKIIIFRDKNFEILYVNGIKRSKKSLISKKSAKKIKIRVEKI